MSKKKDNMMNEVFADEAEKDMALNSHSPRCSVSHLSRFYRGNCILSVNEPSCIFSSGSFFFAHLQIKRLIVIKLNR